MSLCLHNSNSMRSGSSKRGILFDDQGILRIRGGADRTGKEGKLGDGKDKGGMVNAVGAALSEVVAGGRGVGEGGRGEGIIVDGVSARTIVEYYIGTILHIYGRK